jgi:hypothetical protein
MRSHECERGEDECSRHVATHRRRTAVVKISDDGTLVDLRFQLRPAGVELVYRSLRLLHFKVGLPE